MATSTQLKHMLTLESEPGPFVSLFVPYPDFNRVAFESLIDSAKHALSQRYPNQDWRPYQNKLRHFQFPHLVAATSLKGLALYIGPTILRVFKLNYAIHPHSVVNDTMWIIPLINKSPHRLTRQLQSCQQGLISRDLLTAVKLAPAGLINTLIINPNQPRHIQRILNDLAITTIGFDGQVFVLRKGHVLNQSPVIAIRRKP